MSKEEHENLRLMATSSDRATLALTFAIVMNLDLNEEKDSLYIIKDILQKLAHNTGKINKTSGRTISNWGWFDRKMYKDKMKEIRNMK